MLIGNQASHVVSSVVTPVALEGHKIPALNQFGGAAAAYSLRRLKSWGDGARVVDVRRSTDDAERSFTAAAVADGTLVDWVGSGDGYVSTWYDQSGNDNHATQNTATRQPKIVEGGVMVDGGLKFEGAQWIGIDSDIGLSGDDNPISYFTVADAGSTDVGDYGANIVSLGNSTSSQPLSYLAKHRTEYRFLERDDAANLAPYSVGTFSAPSVFTGITTGNDRAIYVDGDNIGSNSVNLGQRTFDRFTIGALRRSSTQNFLNGTIQEIILYDSDQSANREAIETNINDHYEIY